MKHDRFDPEKTTTSKYPTALFWNRLGLAVLILFTLLGIGTCTAIIGTESSVEELTTPIVRGNHVRNIT